MSRVVLVALLFAVASMARPVHAQSTPQPTPETATTKLGSITGRVLVDGQAVNNASITVTRVGATTASRFVPTNDNGDFEAKGLEPGVYRINASAPGYVTAVTDSDDETYYRVGDSVALTMLKGGVITGKVLNVNEDPVVAVRVRAIRIRDENGKSVMTPEFQMDRLTDDRGVYRIFGLRPGTYVVAAGGRGPNEWGLNGYDRDVPTYAPSSTRDTAAAISLASGEEKTIDVHYRGDAGYRVSGSVAASPAPNASWFYINLARLIDGAPDVRMSTYQQSGGKGFEFAGIGDGDYLIWAQTSAAGESFSSDVRRITVKGADVTGIELTTKPLASVAGEFVLTPSTAEACKGKRQPSFDETVISFERKQKLATKAEPEIPPFAPAQVSTDQLGKFVLRNLAPGKYDLDVRFRSRYWFLQSISQRAATPQTVDLARSSLTLKLGDRATGVKVTLAAGAATLSGQVEAPENQPLPAAMFVYLVPAEKEKGDDPLRYSAAPVEADGSFVLEQLAPGRYWLIARVASDNLTRKSLRSPDAAEARAKLRREAELAKSELTFEPCQNVTGYKLSFKSN